MLILCEHSQKCTAHSVQSEWWHTIWYLHGCRCEARPWKQGGIGTNLLSYIIKGLVTITPAPLTPFKSSALAVLTHWQLGNGEESPEVLLWGDTRTGEEVTYCTSCTVQLCAPANTVDRANILRHETTCTRTHKHNFCISAYNQVNTQIKYICRWLIFRSNI